MPTDENDLDYENDDEPLENDPEEVPMLKKPPRSKTITMPKVQNMDNYIIRHYKTYILQNLNECLVNGRISELIGLPVKSERILPEECCFRHFNYWRINRTDFWVDIELRMELKVQTDAGVDTDFYWFNVELWFSYSDGDEECTFETIINLSDKEEPENCWKLDKYLVPVLRRDEVDKYSEAMWNYYLPEAAKDGKQRSASVLAEKMGLSIVKVPLYRKKHIRGMIFFHKGQVTSQPPREPGEHEDPPPHEVTVKENTILLNTEADSPFEFSLDIYHECIHFEWHYLFYRLQDMHNNDINQLRTVRKTTMKDRDFSNPVEFMEHQARYGSYGLMMPITFMKEKISSLYEEAFSSKRNTGNFDHDGRRYDFIARNIASTYHLSKAQVRARMLQLGYTAARGALNYVDGRYITPFAFSELENARGNETYVIDRKHIALLYKTDKTFQQIMQSGHFAYVDGHVVYCDSGNIRQSSNGAYLSAWANAHIDRVSLRFSKTYIGDHKYKYTFGQMNSEEALKNTFKFLDVNGSMTVKEAEEAKNRLMEEMPMSFHGALAYIMKGRMTVEELEKRIPLSRRQILRLRTEDRKKYELDQVIAICIGLNLPPWLSEILLDKAGLSVKRYGTYGYYGTILDCFYMDTIKEVQSFLKDNGYEPLKLNFDPEDSY